MHKSTFRGKNESFKLMNVHLQNSAIVKYRGISVSGNLISKAHVEERLTKAKKSALPTSQKCCNRFTNNNLLYKSLILPVMLYGVVCIKVSRTSLKQLPEETFQKKSVKCITGLRDVIYENQHRLLNVF